MKKLLTALLLVLPFTVNAQPALWMESNNISKNINGGDISKNDTIAVVVKVNPNFSTIRSVYFDFQHQKDAISLISVTTGDAIPQNASVNINNYFYPNCQFNRNANNTTSNGWANWNYASYTCNSSTVPYAAIDRIMVNVSSNPNLSPCTNNGTVCPTYLKLKFQVTNTTAGFPYDSVYMNFAVGYASNGSNIDPTLNSAPRATWIQLAPGSNNLISGTVKFGANLSNALRGLMQVQVTDTNSIQPKFIASTSLNSINTDFT